MHVSSLCSGLTETRNDFPFHFEFMFFLSLPFLCGIIINVYQVCNKSI